MSHFSFLSKLLLLNFDQSHCIISELLFQNACVFDDFHCLNQIGVLVQYFYCQTNQQLLIIRNQDLILRGRSLLTF